MAGVLKIVVAVLALCWIGAPMAQGQAELFGWGELRGIRVDGELRRVSTHLVVAAPGWKEYASTGHWRTRDQFYAREAGAIISRGAVALRDTPAVSFKQTLRDLDANTCALDLEIRAEEDALIEGVYLFVGVPAARFGSGSVRFIDAQGAEEAPIALPDTSPPDAHLAFADAAGVRFVGTSETASVRLGEGVARFIVRDDRRSERGVVTAFVPLHEGTLKRDTVIRQRVIIRVDGQADTTPARVTIDPIPTGATWEGIGGNFCWGTDQLTMDFYLDQLDLAWARVNLPLNHWQPDAQRDPLQVPLEAQPDLIRESIRVARALHGRGIPMMLATWDAPEWSHRRAGTDGYDPKQFGRTVPLDPDKLPQVADAVVSYLRFFTREVGVEPAYFQFNEPNLGINVRQTPEEHAQMNRLLGDAIKAAGLKTRLLLGDVNEPRDTGFVVPSLNDPSSLKHVGALALHSWNGGTDEQLRTWRDHARRAGLPLYITEAGHDPDAHRYRPILEETWYALDDGELNLRCINLAGAATLMHWQLTPDYGLVQPDASKPDGIATSQRWFQYSQIDRFTPRGASIHSARSDRDAITAAALEKDGKWVIHLTNREAARPVTIAGLAQSLKRARPVLTDRDRPQHALPPIDIRDGELTVTLPALSMITLTIE